MKIYLSGPISGDPEFREKFELAAQYVKSTGNEPVNPAEIEVEPERAAFALLVGLTKLYECDGMWLLPGWQDSRGARIERLFAEYMGIYISELPPEGQGLPIEGNIPRGFGKALEWLRDGFKVTRRGWNGKGQFVMLCVPEERYYTLSDGETYGRREYLYIKAADDTLVPWVASQTDLLAEDWEIVL